MARTGDWQHFGVYLLPEILCFKGKLFNLKIEPKLENENDFSDRRLRM